MTIDQFMTDFFKEGETVEVEALQLQVLLKERKELQQAIEQLEVALNNLASVTVKGIEIGHSFNKPATFVDLKV